MFFGTFSCCILPLQGLLKHLDFASAVRLDNWCNALSFLNNAFCTKPSFLALNPLLSCFQCLGLRIAYDLVPPSENLYLHMIYYNTYIYIYKYNYMYICIHYITYIIYLLISYCWKNGMSIQFKLIFPLSASCKLHRVQVQGTLSLHEKLWTLGFWFVHKDTGVPRNLGPLLGGGFNYFLCSPRSLGKWSNLTSIFFQMGWFNHQLACWFSEF